LTIVALGVHSFYQSMGRKKQNEVTAAIPPNADNGSCDPKKLKYSMTLRKSTPLHPD
jgi:hypothetical protein